MDMGLLVNMLEKAGNSMEYKLETLENEITEKILEIMKRKNISRAELAEKLDVSRAAVTKLFRHGSNITIKRLLVIAEALESTVEVRICSRNAEQELYTMSVKPSAEQYDNVYNFEKARRLRENEQTRTLRFNTEISFEDLSEEHQIVGNGY